MSYPLARWAQPLTAPQVSGARTPADAVHRSAQALADLAAEASGQPFRPVPVVRPHGLADQLTVLTREALTCAPDRQPDVAAILVALRRTL